MIFHDRSFLLFHFPLVCIAFSILPAFRFQILIAFSMYLLALSGWHDLIALLCSVVTNFYLSRHLASKSSSRRGLNAMIAVTLNIGFMVAFKISPIEATATLIPLGISFYTFQQIGYQLDIKNNLMPLPNFTEYIFTIVFFPHLAAGPIVQFRKILAQIRSPGWKIRPIELNTANLGLLLIGLSKKIFVADRLAPWVDDTYTTISDAGINLNLGHFLLGTFGYGYQVYFDFSGYSDIAVALALILGIELPTNFNSPFQSRSMVEFWRRWHISLSTFIREYVYEILKPHFNKKWSRPLLPISIMGTIGLWHGLSWMFLLWGLAHGFLISINHLFIRAKVDMPRWLSLALTFVGVNCLWPLFRNIQSNEVVRLFRAALNPLIPPTHVLLLTLPTAVVLLAPNSMTIRRWLDQNLASQGNRIQSFIACFMTITGVLLILFTDYRAAFLYFRF